MKKILFLAVLSAFFTSFVIIERNYPYLNDVGKTAGPLLEKEPDWGFFGHKRINRMAVFTLPPELILFYKPNIDYVTDHAADPDMRRYAVSWEGPRHFIDLDVYDKQPPASWTDAIMLYSEVKGITAKGDTLTVYRPEQELPEELQTAWRSFFLGNIVSRFTNENKSIAADSLNAQLRRNAYDYPAFQSAFFTDHVSQHGVLPWNLQTMYNRLVRAFRNRDSRSILKLSADIGHYIGDAHVPLHTSSNYNGQKTDQYGIHGFWESRIPELFADEQYDYFVGKAEYIGKPSDYFWNIVLESHQLVDSVLSIEWALRGTISTDRQMCPDLRSGIQVLTQCRDFAAAYQRNMDGMVERRMRSSVHAVASVWYSAWLDAGSPDMTQLDVPIASDDERKEEEELIKGFQSGRIIGRAEDH